MPAKTANSDTFSSEIATDLPVVVDFWAAWCGPCKALGPIIDSLADEYDGRVKVLKVDVTESPELARSFGVSSIPFIAVLRDGELVSSKVGFAGRKSIEDLFESLIEG